MWGAQSASGEDWRSAGCGKPHPFGVTSVVGVSRSRENRSFSSCMHTLMGKNGADFGSQGYPRKLKCRQFIGTEVERWLPGRKDGESMPSGAEVQFGVMKTFWRWTVVMGAR